MRTLYRFKHNVDDIYEHITLRDWKFLKYVILKNVYKSLNFENKHKDLLSKYSNETSLAYLSKYNLKIIRRRFDALGEILFDKQYLDLPKFLPKNSQVVFDIGANIGEYSLIASRLVGEDGKVISVEPNPRSYSILSQNVLLNGLTNTKPLNMVVSDTSGEKITLYEYDLPTVTTINKMNTDFNYSFEVESITIDDLVTKLELDSVDIVKIDVEGAELFVLLGSKETIKRDKPKIMVEVHSKKIRERIIKLLEKYGYKIDFERVISSRMDPYGFDYVSILYFST